jgi:hypothetical protein
MLLIVSGRSFSSQKDNSSCIRIPHPFILDPDPGDKKAPDPGSATLVYQHCTVSY